MADIWVLPRSDDLEIFRFGIHIDSSKSVAMTSTISSLSENDSLRSAIVEGCTLPPD
jgi:hypothetical protein